MIKGEQFKQIRNFAKSLSKEDLVAVKKIFQFETWRRNANRQHTNNTKQKTKIERKV